MCDTRIMTVKIEQTGGNYRKRKYHVSYPTVLRTSQESIPKPKRKKVTLSKKKYTFLFPNLGICFNPDRS